MSLKDTAMYYFNVLSLSVVPLKAKKPLVKWRDWRFRMQTEDEFASLPWDVADGIALIGGSKTLGGLYFCAIDYDVKELPKEAVDRGAEMLKLLPETRVERTPSGGQHWLYFCKKPYQYMKRFHGCCAIEILGSSWLTIMCPSIGYSVVDGKIPICMIDDFEFLLKKMSNYDTKKIVSKEVRNNNNLLLVSGYPQCVLNAVDELVQTGELDHEERLFLSTYLVNRMDVKSAIDVIKVAKDFSYSKTLYQVNWLKNSGYKPCKCDKIIEMGLCQNKCVLYPYPM